MHQNLSSEANRHKNIKKSPILWNPKLILIFIKGLYLSYPETDEFRSPFSTLFN
jgi:hypothetical protein